MDDLIARLEQLSGKLNTTSDAISESLKRVEEKLATLRLGVEVWLRDKPLFSEPDFDDDDKLMYTEETYLGYAKVNGTWHLSIASNYGEIMNYENPWRPYPIHEASRELRIAALKQIPELLAAIEKKGEDQLYQVQSALDSLTEVTAPVMNSKPKQ